MCPLPRTSYALQSPLKSFLACPISRLDSHGLHGTDETAHLHVLLYRKPAREGLLLLHSKPKLCEMSDAVVTNANDHSSGYLGNALHNSAAAVLEAAAQR